MSREVKTGMVDYSVFVFIPDSASTDGSGKTGLVAANLTVSGARMETDNDATITDYTSSLNNLAALTTAHTDWGFLEVSSTLAPGLYRLDIADAIFASGAWSSVVYVMVTTSQAAATPMEFILIPQSPIDGVLLAPTTHTSAVIPTVSTLTGNTAQTGDSFARIGAAGAGLTDLGGMSTTMKSQVNAEVLDVLNTDTFAEPAQGTPGATISLAAKIGFLYKAWRNKTTTTATQYNVYNDDTTTIDHKSTLSDDGTTATKTEVATGP